MRFGNGAWSMLPGVTPTYLTRVDETLIREREVVFHVGSRSEKERWATLQGHMFTVRISSPADNVVRVEVRHHKGRRPRGPSYVLNADPRPLAAHDSAGVVEITTGGLKLVITKDPWGLKFVDSNSGEPVTSSPYKASGLMEVADRGVFMREQLTLRPGEMVYGLGERFQAFTRNGQSVEMWNDDCGTCSDKGYKDVSFFLTSAGYGVFVNTPARVSFEIGTEQVMRSQFGVPGEDLDYVLLYGPSPKEVLNRYGALTGRPALPPSWSFGLWLTTSFVTDYDEKTVMGFVDGMITRNIPLHVFHFDCFWMKAHHWVNFRWDDAVFPDPDGMLRRLKAKGLRVCVWINSYVGERSHLFDEGMSRGFLLKRPNGDVYQRPKWQAGMGFVDFTNPAAVAWYQDKLRSLVRMGVDAFKTDFGEEIPTDVVYFDGSDPEKMHNFYTYLYNKTVFELLEEERGAGEAVVFARSATATSQRFPVHWGGDSYGTFESMAESLRGGLSLAMSGFGFWSHDIGGFESTSPPSVYKRWIAFGLMSSHSRLHGNASYRVPWLYDEEAVDVLRHFTEIKCSLMPYLMSSAVEAVRTSVPMMRSMILEFPGDPTCRTLDRQYMLGGDLLVAPVFHEARAEYYLPEGEWTHLLTGEVRAGGRWLFDVLDYFGMPLWMRPNAVIPIGSDTKHVDYDYVSNVRLALGKLDGSTQRTIELFDRQGRPATRFGLAQSGRKVVVTNLDGRRDYRVQLPWATRVDGLEGGAIASSLGAKRKGGGNFGGVEIVVSSPGISFSW
ncbi:MAG TPA: alpha-xylosidase [Polyangiaceae bacterium]|nr:alpha-xylosidase [Polyangiaceae bacterium]